MKHLTLNKFESLDTGSRESYLRDIEEALEGSYRLEDVGKSSLRLPLYKQAENGLKFRLVLGGEFTMGLSAREEKAARAIADPPPFDPSVMRPTKRVSVGPFLMSVSPLLVSSARSLVEKNRLSPYLRMLPENPNAPIYVDRESALAIARALGCRLPYEAEWEYACRASTQTLFAWGDELPPEKELGEWLDFGLSPQQWRQNQFGLHLLFTGDWCMDSWSSSHEGSTSTDGDFVIKGGGSIFWPWQDQEWIWCMPAMRSPSSGLGENGCSFRLVKGLR